MSLRRRMSRGVISRGRSDKDCMRSALRHGSGLLSLGTTRVLPSPAPCPGPPARRPGCMVPTGVRRRAPGSVRRADVLVPELGMRFDERRQERHALGMTTSTPRSSSHPWPPSKVRASPTTRLPMPNWRTSPLQYQHGDSVVTITQSA